MILKELRMTNIRHFSTKAVHFGKGINIISGPNESGKSTIVDCLTKMLFTRPGSASGKSLLRWGTNTAKAELTYIGADASEYRLVKEFGENGKTELWKGDTILTENESRIHKMIISETGVNDERVFRNIFCLSQGDMLRISGEGAKTKESIIGLISGSQQKITSRQAVDALEDEVKRINGISRSPDINLQKGALGCLEEEKRALNENLGNSEKIDDIRKKLFEVNTALQNKKEAIDNYEDILRGSSKYRELSGLRQDEAAKRLTLHRKVNEVIKLRDRVEEKNAEIKRFINRISPVLLMAGIVLFAWGAVVFSSGRVPEGIAGWFSGMALIAAFMVSPKRRLKHEREVLLAKLEVLAGEGGSEKLEEAEQEQLQKVFNIEKTIAELRKYNIKPTQVIGHEKLLEKNKAEYEALENSMKTLEAEKKAFGSISSDKNEILDSLNWVDERLCFLGRRLTACRIAIECLREAISQTRQNLAPELKTETESIIDNITGGRYNNIDIDKKDFNISVLSTEKGDYVSVDELSMGAADQVYFALRMVLSRIVSHEKQVPLIFDDPFVNFDESRKGKAMGLLDKLSDECQILMFTCSDMFHAAGRSIRI